MPPVRHWCRILTHYQKEKSAAVAEFDTTAFAGLKDLNPVKTKARAARSERRPHFNRRMEPMPIAVIAKVKASTANFGSKPDS